MSGDRRPTDGDRYQTGGHRGATLVVVLWLLVALGALSFVAAMAARTDRALTRAWSDHAATLGLAEAGVADALSAIASGGSTTGSRRNALATGTYEVVWEPAGDRIRVVSTGARGGSRRTVEVHVGPKVGDRLHIAAWREIR